MLIAYSLVQSTLPSHQASFGKAVRVHVNLYTICAIYIYKLICTA